MSAAKIKKAAGVLVIFFIIIMLTPICVRAEEIGVPSEYNDVIDLLPDFVKELLPEDMLDADTAGQGLESVMSADRLFSTLGKLVGDGLPKAVSLLCTLVGLTVLSALIRALVGSVESSALSGAFSLCSSLVLFAAVIATEISHLEKTVGLLEDLNALMSSMIPITASVWAMGGNIGTASLSGATLYGFLALCERLCVNAVTPVCLIITAVALCGATSSELKLGGISGAVKKAYNFTAGLMMSLLVALLGMQTALSSASDGLAAKTAKLISSTVIPVVGGSVGDTLKSVAGSVSYVKSVFGISGIIFIFLLVAPTLITVLLARAAFIITGAIADMLGCERESRLLSQMSDVYGCMVGVLSMSAVMFILALGIFVKSTVAIS